MQTSLENRCMTILFDQAQINQFNQGINRFFPDSIPQHIKENPNQALEYLIQSKIPNPRDEANYQRLMASLLRRLAIRTLREGEHEVIKHIRDQYQELSRIDTAERYDYDTFEKFLIGQSRNGEYAQSFEATALAVALDVGFKYCTVDPRTNRPALPAAIELYSAGVDSDTVLLYNSPNHHYFIREGESHSTVPDGNCLYNGFAQHLKLFALKNNPEPVVITGNQKVSGFVPEPFHLYTPDFLSQQKVRFAKLESKKYEPKGDTVPVLVGGVLKDVSLSDYIKMEQDFRLSKKLDSKSFLSNFFTHPKTEIISKTLFFTGLVSCYVSMFAIFFPVISQVLSMTIPAMFLVSLAIVCVGKLMLDQFHKYQKEHYQLHSMFSDSEDQALLKKHH
jgi:hypothetical protein